MMRTVITTEDSLLSLEDNTVARVVTLLESAKPLRVPMCELVSSLSADMQSEAATWLQAAGVLRTDTSEIIAMMWRHVFINGSGTHRINLGNQALVCHAQLRRNQALVVTGVEFRAIECFPL